MTEERTGPTGGDWEEPGACPLQEMIRTSVPAEEGAGGGPSWTVRIKRMLKRRLSVTTQKKMKRAIGSFLDRMAGRGAKAPEAAAEPAPGVRLEAGDAVRVRSREAIEATLDHWRSYKGCAFLKEMAAYCGTTQRVLKRVERFIDERDYRFKKASGVVLLEGLTCSGTASTGRCDRACFFFWREEWLEKTSGPPGGES